MSHWSQLTRDPMAPVVIERRRRSITSARRSLIDNRTEYLCELARGRRVLDIGIVDHDLSTERSARWLHGELAAAAGSILGLDILEDDVQVLRDRGYNVACMDITAGQRPEGTFDLIVAGELIEHVGAPGGVFDAAADLLSENGRLVVTTPNPHTLWRMWQHLRDRPYENVDHVTFHTPGSICELAERAGLRLDAFAGLSTRAESGKARLMQRLVGSRVVPIVPESVCDCVLYEFVHDEATHG